MPTKTTTPTFRALPEATTDRAPYDRKPLVIDDNTPTPARLAKPRPDLPATGPGEVRGIPIGPRIVFAPTDAKADFLLRAAEAQFGRSYDHKQRAWLSYWSNRTRNGAADPDSTELLALTTGIALTFDEAGRRSLASYRRHLGRQRRPIPRVIWRDDADHEIDEDGATVINLAHQRR